MSVNTITTKEGDTLSAIAYRRYGISPGQVERILEANTWLCEWPVLLPPGVVITMPAEQSKTKKINTLNLWD